MPCRCRNPAELSRPRGVGSRGQRVPALHRCGRDEVPPSSRLVAEGRGLWRSCVATSLEERYSTRSEGTRREGGPDHCALRARGGLRRASSTSSRADRSLPRALWLGADNAFGKCRSSRAAVRRREGADRRNALRAVDVRDALLGAVLAAFLTLASSAATRSEASSAARRAADRSERPPVGRFLGAGSLRPLRLCRVSLPRADHARGGRLVADQFLRPGAESRSASCHRRPRLLARFPVRNRERDRDLHGFRRRARPGRWADRRGARLRQRFRRWPNETVGASVRGPYQDALRITARAAVHRLAISSGPRRLTVCRRESSLVGRDLFRRRSRL